MAPESGPLRSEVVLRIRKGQGGLAQVARPRFLQGAVGLSETWGTVPSPHRKVNSYLL